MNVENASLLRRSSRIDAKKASQNEESNFERRLNVECRINEDKTSQSLLNEDTTNTKCRQNEFKTSQSLLNEDTTNTKCRQIEDKTSSERRLNVDGTSQSRQNDEKSNTECRINVTKNVEKMGRRKNVETMGRRQIEKRPKKRRQLRTMTTIHIRPDFAQRETVEVRV